MSETIKKIKVPLMVAALCVILYFVYATYFKADTSVSPDKIQTAVDSTGVPVEEQQFLNLLLKIKNITIDTRVFDNPVFASLQDDGLAIIEQPKGRRNPFAPIGANGGDATFSTTTQTVTTPR